MPELTPEQLAALTGTILSLLFEYVPPLEQWYSAQTNTMQRLIMLLALLVTTIGVAAYSCGSACEFTAWLDLFFLAVVANQVTYLISPKVSQKAG